MGVITVLDYHSSNPEVAKENEPQLTMTTLTAMTFPSGIEEYFGH